MTEYYMDPEANARSFTDDLFYCTGDEAVLVKNGRIRILGRVVELINRCGEKITPSEVEEMLMKIDTVSEAHFCFPASSITSLPYSCDRRR